MNRRLHPIVILLLSLLVSFKALSQAPEKPDSIYYLTVDPETGYDIMVWFPSPSPGVDYYQVGEAQPSNLDNLSPVGDKIYVPVTFFVNYNSESSNRPAYYSVWAVNDDGHGVSTPSLWDAVHNTIYLSARYDSCVGTIDLEWNSYIRWTGKIREYNIKRRTSPGHYVTLNPSPIPEGTNRYTLDHLAVNENYEIFIEAVHIDGVRASNSNMISVFNDITPGPGYINADFATITTDNQILLSFTPEIASPYEYSLERAAEFNGTYDVVSTFTNSGNSFYLTDNVDASSDVFFYKLMIKDVCGHEGVTSNIASNILLTGEINQYTVNLGWNNYLEWLGGVNSYEVRRFVSDGIPDGTFNTGTANVLTDDLSPLINYLTPVNNEVCYEVSATENSNIYGIRGTSLSNRLCFRVNINVRFPNAIIPNDGEPMNRVFEPVFDFLPDSYEIIIYNRLGLKIWEGSGPWDGTSAGKPVPEGVYLYYVRVTTGTDKPAEYSGKLTVLYR